MIRGLAGCTVYLQECSFVLLMLAHECLHREDARTAILGGSGRPADGADRAGAVGERGVYRAVGDDPTLADDHADSLAVGKACLTELRVT
jgi:hypothetical protein